VEHLKTIDLLFGGHWMEVSVSDYVVDFQNGVCAFCIDNTGDYNVAILGDSFMRNFYVVHDMANMQMGFAPLVGGTKAPIVSGSTPSCGYNEDCSTSWFDVVIDAIVAHFVKNERFYMILVLVIVFVVIPIFLIWYVYIREPKKKKEEEFNPFKQPDDGTFIFDDGEEELISPD
jgi:hypothetical protein